MNWFWLLRLSQWARNPPPARKVRWVLGVLAACLAVYAVERWIGWPAALSVDPGSPPTRVLR